ncbi:class I SAM-dependent methyltransferase [Coprothermobacter platensis]|uniref:class I SAM-dependent methyltransferase n=1 Tax=Coprothermobacter platensis TaxID=108819 RepID=UPI000365BEC2|nr:class I SAM-dependent methyltransferase [Coprothermobacter platensis]
MELSDKEFFNSIASEWDSRTHHDPIKVQDVLSYVHVTEGSSVLDVGCGTGALTPYLLELVCPSGQIVGLDYSENMLKIAKTKFPKETYPNIDFILGDIMTFSPTQEFDFVICYSSFPHFPDKEGSIRKMAKLLKKGGKLAILHSESREHINTMHRNMGENMENIELPDSDTLTGYMVAANLNVETIIDNDEKYAIVAVK